MNWRQHDYIMVVVYNLTKEAHFIPVKILMKDIFKLHGLPNAIVSNRDVKFTSNFWKGFFAYLGTKLNFNTTYHPQTDG